MPLGHTREGGCADEPRARRPACGVTFRMRGASGAVSNSGDNCHRWSGMIPASAIEAYPAQAGGDIDMNRYRKTTLALAAQAALATVFVGISPAGAQEIDIGEIVVTPNRAPTDKAKTGSKVETVTKEEIEARSQPTVIDYLNTVPGVAISQPGSVGGEGSLAVRGQPKRYVKTLLNGIDIGDPTAPQVQTSYQYLVTGGIESIEVLKGSQSTLYGSEAIAGVISLSTLTDYKIGVQHIFQVEGGSFGTALGRYGFRGATDASRVGINITGFRTDGISSASNGQERDGYENVTVDAAVEHRFSENFSVFGSLLYINASAEFDDSFPIGDNLTATNHSKQLAGRMGFNVDLLDGRSRNTFSVQGFDIDRSITGTSFDGEYLGDRVKADYQGAFDVNDWITFQYGADYERQSIEVPGARADFTMGSAWGQVIVEPVDNLTVTVGGRYDEHSDFGGHGTYRVSGSYLLDTGTRLHASLGTGFRAPSLNELYGPFGANPLLQPETSVSYDVGVEQRRSDRLVGDLTFFQIDIDNLIGYTWPVGYTQVPGVTTSRGVEASVAWTATDWLSMAGSYTYTDSQTATGARNVRVPRHAIGLSTTVTPAEKWLVSATGKVAIDTVDSGNFRLDDYFLLNAKVAYKPTEATEVYVRVENAFDVDYEVVRGYSTPGFAAYAGLKASF